MGTKDKFGCQGKLLLVIQYLSIFTSCNCWPYTIIQTTHTSLVLGYRADWYEGHHAVGHSQGLSSRHDLVDWEGQTSMAFGAGKDRPQKAI